MTKPKNKSDKQVHNFEKEDAILKQIQINRKEVQKEAANAPDILDELRKKDKALEYVKSLSDADVDELYVRAHQKYAGDINGVPFDEWFKQAQKYYTVDANFVVHSNARSPKPENIDSVPCLSLAHARYRVLQLILYKLRDHGERGCDFTWID